MAKSWILDSYFTQSLGVALIGVKSATGLKKNHLSLILSPLYLSPYVSPISKQV
jgi:hypothetical protein